MANYNSSPNSEIATKKDLSIDKPFSLAEDMGLTQMQLHLPSTSLQRKLLDHNLFVDLQNQLIYGCALSGSSPNSEIATKKDLSSDKPFSLAEDMGLTQMQLHLPSTSLQRKLLDHNLFVDLQNQLIYGCALSGSSPNSEIATKKDLSSDKPFSLAE
ncbi:MAG: hypothetical protein RSB02_06335, partial [Anaerovoracaceae bacterium]